MRFLPPLMVLLGSASIDSRAKDGGRLSIIHEGKALANYSMVSVMEGDSLVLNCALDVVGGPSGAVPKQEEFRWFDGDGRLVGSSQTLEVDGVYADSKSKLKRYGCGLATDDDDGSRTYVIAKVIRAPSFTITRVPAFGIPVLEGMTVVLSCQVELDDEIRTTVGSNGTRWMKDELLLEPSDESVTIMIAESAHVGWYQCFTDVRNERFSSVGYFLNIVTPPAAAAAAENRSADDAGSREEGLKGGSVQELAGAVVYEAGIEVTANCSCCRPVGEATFGGGGVLPDYLYAPPFVRPLNGSKILLEEAAERSTLILGAEICSNPKAEKIFWTTPDSRAVKAGERVENFLASQPTSHPERATCVLSRLDIDLKETDGFLSAVQEGEYSVIAKNRHGMTEAQLVVRNAVNKRRYGKTVALNSALHLSGPEPRALSMSLVVVLAKLFKSFCG